MLSRPPKAHEVLREALRLPAGERATLAAERLASLDSEAAEDPAAVEAAWAVEIETRAQRIRSGESAGIAWEEVRRLTESALRNP